MSNWRSPRLLAGIKTASLAGDAPCFWPIPHACTRYTPGTVVYMHSNRGEDGKGMRIKAHDYRIALGCFDAHAMYDQGGLPRNDAVIAFDHAHRKTVGWLIENSLLVVA